MHVILIGNYPLDGQESMERFAQMLETGFRKAGVSTELWRPIPVFAAGGKSTEVGLRKWLGYVDKWLVFPLVLRWRLRRKELAAPQVHFHVCDHSNAPYLGHLRRERTSITCHDVIAIRGGLGHADAHATPSRFGRKLQQWIFHHLSRAERLATVSALTFRQLTALVGNRPPAGTDWRTIPLSFNAEFRPLTADESMARLLQVGFSTAVPFVLHVGSGHPRKNRGLLLDMVHALGDRWTGNICFAGEAPGEELLAKARTLGLSERVVAVVKPKHDTLVALYSACEAFIFPSYSEGFGWPVIEAQACGAPVIASTVEPMPEVSGGAALHASPDDAQAFAAALLSLQDPVTRAAVVQRGFENCRRFESESMIRSYLNLYQRLPA